MASLFRQEKKKTGQLRTRKGHDMTWSCDKHAEPIAFQCKKHKISICHRCATKDHGQKPCVLEDIEDVILEMKEELEDTQTEIAAAKKRLQAFDSKIKSKETSANNHLQSVNDEINATYDGKLKSMKDEIRLINEEADEEIRTINEKRETRIKACKEEAEEQQQISKDIQAKLLSEIKKIDMTIRKKFEDLKSKNHHEINILDNMDSKIERIKQNDKTLVTEAPQVIASLGESLSSNNHQEVADYLERIEREVQRVKFVEGEVGGKHYGRIDGYIGKWKLVKRIDMPWLSYLVMCGLISDDEICVSVEKRSGLYVTNIGTGRTQKVIKGDCDIFLTSCAAVDSNVIVCGKMIYCGGDSLDRSITLYDRQWQVIRDITTPRDTPYHQFSTVDVDVDMDGLILAAEYGQSNIYVINPADGKIVNTVTMQGKNVVWIQALSSGDIVVQAGGDKQTVISRSGEEKAVIHCDEWKYSRCYVDKLTDTLYITYWDEERNGYTVDQVSRDGNIQAKRIVEYKQSNRSPHINLTCLVTPSGNLVACDGDKLFVYKKSFIV